MGLRRRIGAVLAASALVLTACGGGGNAQQPGSGALSERPARDGVTKTAPGGGEALAKGNPQRGGTLTYGLYAPAETLDPVVPSGNAATPIMMAVYGLLFHADAEGNVVPDMAKGLETPDQGKTWVIKLDPAIKFSDGAALDSAAVKKHYERIAAEGSRSPSAAAMRAVENIETTDPTTVTMTLKQASMAFPKVFLGVSGMPVASFIPSPNVPVEQMSRNPVGAGPFKVQNYSPGGDATLVRNETYYEAGKPYLDSIKFVTATDTQARLGAIKSGTIDIATTQSGVDILDAEAAGVTALIQPNATYFDMLMNNSKAPFDDKEFRRAVIQAIDLNALNDAVFNGTHTVMTGIVPPDNANYVDTGWPSYDLAAAKAGVEAYKAKGGNPTFTLTSTSPPEFMKMSQLMQQMLAEAGITMNIEVGDQPTMVTQAFSGNYQSQLRFTSVSAETDGYIRNDYRTGLPSNLVRSGDPKVDQVLDDLTRVETPADRKAKLAELQRALTDWLPLMPMIAHHNAYLVGKKVNQFPGGVTTSFFHWEDVAAGS